MFIFDNFIGVQFISNINCFLSQSLKCCLIIDCHYWGIFFFFHMGFDFINMLIKYNQLLKMFTKMMDIYECSRPWCFFWSCARVFLIWKICSFTKTEWDEGTNRYEKVSLFSIIDFYSHDVWFYQWIWHIGIDCISVWELWKEKYFGVICTSS